MPAHAQHLGDHRFTDHAGIHLKTSCQDPLLHISGIEFIFAKGQADHQSGVRKVALERGMIGRKLKSHVRFRRIVGEIDGHRALQPLKRRLKRAHSRANLDFARREHLCVSR